ncbi:ABC transporter substrate-binding protein [Streptomyces millisiae]|uniref:ABC transporter substrate-binding protein n=1 Tax=Streptomyces millisiae TaxID=3075542 RepID=A0ABU2LWK5_9ACTN|nr:ABC transporter substrate-binding protein [Streptomyces sp. DSM 44918]MDT0321986.1 ABC transporter substrate-binding protein [Streptomyces sp. DSM 44918]
MRSPAPRPGTLTRRTLLAASGAGLLAACGSDAGDAQAGQGGWRFTDDRGETATLDATPERVVAYVASAAALHDFGVTCAAIFGPSSPVRGEPNPQAGDLDVDRLTSLGEAWGEFNVERYARLEPQLLVSNMNPGPDLWYVPEESKDDILALAPSVGIGTKDVSAPQVIQRYAELAEALGADLGAGTVREARSRFDAASESLRRAARDNPGVRVMAVAANPREMAVAVPDSYPDLTYFSELGVELVRARVVDEWGYWHTLSWENADTYHADLIILDNRAQATTPEELAEVPTWARLPAVEAGQVAPWPSEERFSYQGYAAQLERLAEAVRTAERLD